MPDRATTPGTSSSAVRQSMRDVYERVETLCDLPPLPAVAVQAMNLVRDPDVTAEQLAQLVATDVAIAARVLRLSRSALYARRRPPRTLQDAITTVGLDALRKILIAASARSIYERRDRTAEALWSHALATALAADELAVLDGERRGGISFIAGLLHDVGRLVFHVARKHTGTPLPPEDEAGEIALYGVSHAAVGACLAEQWRLEEELVEAILFHHRSEGTGSRLAARIERADRLAREIEAGTPTEAAADDRDAAVAARVVETLDRERALFV